MQNPVSRVSACYQEGPEHPSTAACQAAVAASGTQGFYDWMGVRIGDAAGRHHELIPDGKLCSAGSDEYKGLDLARSDWPATSLPAGGGSYTFKYRGTAPHRGSFQLFVTKDGYDPTKPLKWSDLESSPFYTATDPALVNGSYEMTAQLPKKTGRHLIYAIWQRSDSPEAFYSCSDVVFGGAGSTTGSGSGPSGSATGSGSAPSGSGASGGSTGSGHSGSSTGSGGPGKSSATPGGAATHAGTGSGMSHDGMDMVGTSMSATASASQGGSGPAGGGSGSGTADSSPDQHLASTGASDALPLAGGALVILGVGGAAMVLARRHRGHRRT
ncbi:lytic polysaccharide monooxygenase [Kitasatospora sp. NPDC001159]